MRAIMCRPGILERTDGVINAASRGKSGYLDDEDGGGILRYECYSHLDLISFFGHQLKIKIGTDRKCLLSKDFSEKWVKVATLIRVNGSNHDVLFLSPLGHNKAVSEETLPWIR